MAIPFTRFLITETLAVASMNAGCNAAYAYWQWRDQALVPLAGEGGIWMDLSLTPVFIGLLSVLLGTGAIRQRLWEGKVRAPERFDHRLGRILSVLPRTIILRALMMASACAILLALPLALMLTGTDGAMLPLVYAVIVKVGLTVVLSLAIVPLTILMAARDLHCPAASRPIRALTA